MTGGGAEMVGTAGRISVGPGGTRLAKGTTDGGTGIGVMATGSMAGSLTGVNGAGGAGILSWPCVLMVAPAPVSGVGALNCVVPG